VSCNCGQNLYVAKIINFFSFGLQTEDVFNEIDFCFSYLVNRFYLPVLQLFLIFNICKKNLLTRHHYVIDSRIIKQLFNQKDLRWV